MQCQVIWPFPFLCLRSLLEVGCEEMHLHGSGRETPQEPSAQDCNQEEQHTGHPQCEFYEAADDMGECFHG